MINVIYILDFCIWLTTFAGLFVTMLKHYSFKVTNRSFALLGMYFFFTVYIGLDFLFDHSLMVTDAFLNSGLFSQLVFVGKRVILVCFTLLAIPWSAGFNFWQK